MMNANLPLLKYGMHQPVRLHVYVDYILYLCKCGFACNVHV